MRPIPVLTTAVLAALAATAAPTVAAPPPSAGPPGGIVFTRGSTGQAKGSAGKVKLLQYHGGSVLTGTTPVTPVKWGSPDNANLTAMGTLYGGIGIDNYAPGTATYIGTNGEYWQGSSTAPTPVGLGVTANAAVVSPDPVTTKAPTTTEVLNAVVSAVGANHLVQNAYYPVYSSIPRGTAGYCAWHSYGDVPTSTGSTHITFAFFFDLTGDGPCTPSSTGGQPQPVAALGNVSGHELSEALTDPNLDAWYDQRGYENADKCAWTFNGLVPIAGQNWAIQQNWSNAASSGTGACIQTR